MFASGFSESSSTTEQTIDADKTEFDLGDPEDSDREDEEEDNVAEESTVDVREEIYACA